MFEQSKVLNKIEQWADRLPYKSLKIEIDMGNQTFTLEKNKGRVIGFVPPPMRGNLKEGD